ncbi:MAG TPA: hypothetical protein VM910_17455, partial [Bradyrhizobium sp.]|nr:hypothetical protein [Bradyrhizobium sp.]
MPRKSESKTEVAAAQIPGQVQRLSLFGPPLLLEGEDAAAYDELLARMCAAVKPVDVIDEMLVADIVALQWEVLRWRRLKRTLMRQVALKALERFLIDRLESNYALHEEHFQSYLTEILKNNLPPEQADSAEMLAAECTPNTDEANDKLGKVLSSIGLGNNVLDDARADKAKELAQEYVRGERDAVTLVNELLTDAGVSMDTFMTKALRKRIDEIERIDRLTTIAPPQCRPARDGPASRGPRRNAATPRARDRGRRVYGRRVSSCAAASRRKRGLTSERKITANRANARASTGPRTTRGRARAARNALRHALS